MILLVSSDEKLLTYWEQHLLGYSPILSVSQFSLVKGRMIRSKPNLVLLDYDLLQLNGQETIAQLISYNADVKLIVFNADISDKEEWALFRTGIHGCCRKDISLKQMKLAINTVLNDELWIRRSLTNMMLQELVAVTKEKMRIENAIKELLENLTRREYEIAKLVGRGQSNKRIALKLEITERTVKAHLTEIFRKLHISDRIELALIMKDTVFSLSYPHINPTSIN